MCIHIYKLARITIVPFWTCLIRHISASHKHTSKCEHILGQSQSMNNTSDPKWSFFTLHLILFSRQLHSRNLCGQQCHMTHSPSIKITVYHATMLEKVLPMYDDKPCGIQYFHHFRVHHFCKFIYKARRLKVRFTFLYHTPNLMCVDWIVEMRLFA